jgi:hypothetical protein
MRTLRNKRKKMEEMVLDIPKQAGLAHIHVGSVEDGIMKDGVRWEVPYDHGRREIQDVSVPERFGEDIFLPPVRNAEFHLLNDGSQFLYRIPPVESSRGYRYSGSLYFGGTDENVFLVQLEQRLYNLFIKDGEDRFYDALKPEPIKNVEEKWKIVTKRQGDIFASPLPISWEEIEKVIYLYLFKKPEVVEVEEKTIFGTRHKITGPCIENLQTKTYRPSYSIAEGLIEAPDHTPLELEGLHLLAQTNGLVDPTQAD